MTEYVSEGLLLVGDAGVDSGGSRCGNGAQGCSSRVVMREWARRPGGGKVRKKGSLPVDRLVVKGEAHCRAAGGRVAVDREAEGVIEWMEWVWQVDGGGQAMNGCPGLAWQWIGRIGWGDWGMGSDRQ